MLVCIFFQAERGVFDTLSFLRLVKQLRVPDAVPKRVAKSDFFILIPVFNEQRIIEDTIVRLSILIKSSLNVRIVIITSIREEISKKDTPYKLTTKDVILRALKKKPLNDFKNNIVVLSDPNDKGNMATQLNYGLSVLRKKNNPTDLFMVYNADSIIAPDMLSVLASLIITSKRINTVIQQPCAFVKDFSLSSSHFINALSLYQTCYCLGHEYRILRRYEEKSNNTLLPILGLITGHGSGMRISTHAMYGGYPSGLFTEDLTFGFILSANKVYIRVLPSLEVADVPRQFRSFIQQRSVWFWNYIGYLTCFYQLLKDGKPVGRLLILLTQGVGRGLYWLMLSLFILIPLILGIVFKSPIIILLEIFSILIFLLLPNYIVFRMLPVILEQQKLYEFSSSIKKVSFINVAIPLLIIIITDSIGPWIGIAQGIKYFITGNLPKKYKTDH